jgi:hypothetical protein
LKTDVLVVEFGALALISISLPIANLLIRASTF